MTQLDSSSTKDKQTQSLLSNLWNTGKEWSQRGLIIGTYVGVLIVAIYFLRIRHFPLDGLTSLLSIGGVVALVSFALMASLVVLWGAPAAVMLWFRSEKTWIDIGHIYWTKSKSLNSDDALPLISFRRIVTFAALSIGTLWLFIFILITPDFLVPEEYRFGAIAASGIVWFAGFCYTLIQRRPNVSSFGPLPPEKGILGPVLRTCWHVFFSLSGAYPMLAYSYVTRMSTLEGSGHTIEAFWLLGGLATIVLLQSVVLMIELSSSEENPKLMKPGLQALVVTFCAVLALGFLGAMANFHDRIMQAVSIRASHVHLVLNRSSCDALRLAGVSVSHYSSVPGGEASDLCILLDITVLSKLGEQWRIACDRKSPEKIGYQGFNVNVRDVVSQVDAIGSNTTNFNIDLPDLVCGDLRASYP